MGNNLPEPGDAVVVELDSLSEDGETGYANRGGFTVTIADPLGDAGEYVSVEVVSVDSEDQTISAVAGDRPGLDDQYSTGEVLTVSVDRVRRGDAIVDFGPGRTLSIIGYPHRHQNIEVVIRKVEKDFIRSKRLHQIDRLSTATLVELDHEYPCQYEFSKEISDHELNVFASHLLATESWSLLRYVLSRFADVGSVELSTATTLLEELDVISSSMWRNVLFTVIEEMPTLAASVGADYLASVLINEEVPQAWVESVRGNLALLIDTQGVGIKHHTIEITESTQRQATVVERSLRTRTTDARDATINRKLRETWDDRCSVCGHSATSRHDKTGIEGSHIYPVQYGGVDDIGNILPMCRNHHWAFENGWIAISDSYTVKIHPETPESIQELLAIEDGDELLLISGYEPDRESIAMHRRIHGFETITTGQQFPIKLKNLTEEGASVTFPDGTTVSVPMEALSDGVSRYFAVQVVDVEEDQVKAVPQA